MVFSGRSSKASICSWSLSVWVPGWPHPAAAFLLKQNNQFNSNLTGAQKTTKTVLSGPQLYSLRLPSRGGAYPEPQASTIKKLSLKFVLFELRVFGKVECNYEITKPSNGFQHGSFQTTCPPIDVSQTRYLHAWRVNNYCEGRVSLN